MAILAICFGACSEKSENKRIEVAVKTLISQYPQATLQDVYKSFYQERFGPGHMIPNIENARNYLMYEMVQASENSGDYYEPTGSEGKYVRIYLNAVSDGKISAEQLLDAFVESANHVEPRPDKCRLRRGNKAKSGTVWHQLPPYGTPVGGRFRGYRRTRNLFHSCTHRRLAQNRTLRRIPQLRPT